MKNTHHPLSSSSVFYYFAVDNFQTDFIYWLISKKKSIEKSGMETKNQCANFSKHSYKNYMKSSKIFVLLAGLVFFGCSSENQLRFPNGSVIVSETYELGVADTSKILSAVNNIYTINTFGDSLRTRIDTLWYKEPDRARYEKIFGKLDQAVFNSRNVHAAEFYRFENSGVYLAGYAISDTSESYTQFNPPIIILPKSSVEKDTTIAVMTTFKKDEQNKEKGVTVKSIIELKNRGRILINNKEEDFYLYELTIAQDAIVNYGEQGLIVPEAIVLKSNLLYGHHSGLIAEWGIRSRQKKEESIERHAERQQDRETYLEINYYKQTYK